MQRFSSPSPVYEMHKLDTRERLILAATCGGVSLALAMLSFKLYRREKLWRDKALSVTGLCCPQYTMIADSVVKTYNQKTIIYKVEFCEFAIAGNRVDLGNGMNSKLYKLIFSFFSLHFHLLCSESLL